MQLSSCFPHGHPSQQLDIFRKQQKCPHLTWSFISVGKWGMIWISLLSRWAIIPDRKGGNNTKCRSLGTRQGCYAECVSHSFLAGKGGIGGDIIKPFKWCIWLQWETLGRLKQESLWHSPLAFHSFFSLICPQDYCQTPLPSSSPDDTFAHKYREEASDSKGSIPRFLTPKPASPLSPLQKAHIETHSPKAHLAIRGCWPPGWPPSPCGWSEQGLGQDKGPDSHPLLFFFFF